MITIVKSLPPLVFAGNPCLMKIHTDNLLSTTGIKAYMELAISATDQTAGHYFTLTFNGLPIQLTSAETPDDSGIQFEKASSTDTFGTFAKKIFDALIANYDIASNFDIVLNPADSAYRIISLTAKTAGVKYSLTFVNHDVSGLALEPGSVSGIDPIYRENFVILASIWDEFTKIGEDLMPVASDGSVTFNFSEYLKALLDVNTKRFTWPESSSVFVHEFSNYIQPFKIGLAEKFNGMVQKITYDALRHAIGGGLSREQLVLRNEIGESFFEDSDNKKRFLSWAPLTREIGSSVPQKLFFVFQNVSGYSQYRLAVNVIYQDGSSAKVYRSSLVSITPWRVIELVTGFDQLLLGTVDPIKSVANWSVYLENENGVQISEARGYIIDPDYYENQRVFMFRNSFSAYDIVRFTGKMEMDVNYDRISGYRMDDNEWTSLNAPEKLFSNQETQSMKASSGWIHLDEKKHLRDFMLSMEAYEICEGKLFPIVITSSKAQAFTSDGNTLYSLDIEYNRAYSDIYWSDLISGRVYSDDYNENQYS